MKLWLQIAGGLQLALALAHFDFIRRLGWREDLRQVSVFTRQVFWVHTAFIMLVVAGFGGLSLFYAEDLLAGTSLARAVVAGLACFWGARCYCQFFVYSSQVWRGNRLNTIAHVCFSLLWTFLAGVYAAAFLSGR